MNKFKGLAGLVTGAVMLGISVLPSQSYAKPERIYTQQFGQKNRYDNIATGTNGDIAVYLSPLNQGDISVCDFKKREKRILKKTPDIYEGSPTLSPNGKKVAFFGTRNKKIMLYTSDLKGNYSEVMYVDGLTLGYP
jgi:Tol biopolymer transport system component